MTPGTSPFASAADGEKVAPSAAENVVVGVDGSANAALAARWALEEAERREAILTLVHALHLPTPTSAVLGPMDYAGQRRAEGHALLDEQASALQSGHPSLLIRTQLSDLDPARTLAKLSESATLLVTGSRGRGGFTGMLLGSVSRKLAVQAPCPLVVVRDEFPKGSGNRIVLGIGRKHAPAAIRYAFEAARRQGATLEVVRAYFPHILYTGAAGLVTKVESHPEADEAEVTKEVMTAIEPWIGEFSDVAVKVTAVDGNAVPVLIDAARDAGLLVVAAHRRRGPLRVGAGYVVDGALAHSPTPVAVVPDR